MAVKYHVRLSDDERTMLEKLIKQEKPRIAQYKKRDASILLAIDENHDPLTHEQVAKAFHIRPLNITRLRKRLVEEGLAVAIHGKHNHHEHSRILDGEGEAHLIAISCSAPPEGRCRWTLNLLRNRMIELEYVEKISRSTVHEALKKINSSLGKKRSGVFPKRKAPAL